MDPVRRSVMNNRFTAIVEEASTILYRTAHTTFVKLVTGKNRNRGKMPGGDFELGGFHFPRDCDLIRSWPGHYQILRR